MGAEQSQPKLDGHEREALERTNQNQARRLQKANTVAASGRENSLDDSPTTSELSTRPASPPLSVCYDSDLPYVSYTDRPIGDSPKIRNKGQQNAIVIRSGSVGRKSATNPRQKRPPSTSKHNIVVVRPGAKDNDDYDSDLYRLRSIPTFLPVMRGTLSMPSTREPEILDRLQSVHFQNVCHRMQAHYNICATHVAKEQNEITASVKRIDIQVTTLFANYVDMQKTYASYAEQFSKIRGISQQLSRCNSLLNENIESLETINNFLDVEDRLEPFVWRTEDKRLQRE